MSEVHSRLEKAASHFRDLFLESWLYTSGELEKQGFSLVRDSSGSYLNGSIEEGQFYGGSDISICHIDGAIIEWSAHMLYEAGESWEQGSGYSYVSVRPAGESAFIPVYSIGDIEFPSPQYKNSYLQSGFSQQDWMKFCADFKGLSVKCLIDMGFIFRENLTSKLCEMALGHPDSSLPNPFLSEAQS